MPFGFLNIFVGLLKLGMKDGLLKHTLFLIEPLASVIFLNGYILYEKLKINFDFAGSVGKV